MRDFATMAEARDPGDFSASHQAVNVIGALIRENRLQITERISAKVLLPIQRYF
jgi:hypothetical protein